MNRIWDFWTDGSHITQNSGSSAGWAFVGYDLERRKYVCYGPGGNTNNQGELLAIYYVLDIVRQIAKPGDQVNIYSDSNYSVQTFNSWVVAWKRKGWKKSDGKTPENLQLIQSIDQIRNQLLQSNIQVNFIHVRAHSGIENNEIADRYSNLGRSATQIITELII